jgi:hypothetical protein
MSSVSFSENKEGYLIPHEDGQALCDFEHPNEEAEVWAKQQDVTIANEVVVLGLGAGFHVKALREAHPFLKIHVIECRDSLLPIFKKQVQSDLEHYHVFQSLESLLESDFFNKVIAKTMPVYFFKKSWGAHEDLFYSLWKNLTGRSVYAIARHFANLGVEIDEATLVNLKRTEKPLTIKDATDIVINSESESAKENRGYFEALRELLR